MFDILSILWALLAFVLDVLYGNSWNPSPQQPVVLSALRLQQYQTAIVYAADVFFLDPQNPNATLYPPADTYIFEDSNDRVVVTKKDNTCYAAFKGADVRSVDGLFTDSTQGSGLFGSANVCGSAGCCMLDRGLTGAYYSDYVESFEAQLRSCVASCENSNGASCDVVLTGHSQGASISHVAAVVLADLNPLLFAFGPQKVIHALHFPCPVLDTMDTFYRTVSQCETDQGRVAYDLQPYVGVLWGKNTGTMILVGQGGAVTLARNRDVFLTPAIDKCHNVFNWYMDPIIKLSPGALDGFVTGSKCTRNIECKSQSCVNRRCS